jgi:cytoskeletal protein CcmA (bactofilin family)
MFLSGKRKPGPGRGGSSGLSIIGAEMVVSGDVTTRGQVHVDGRVDGNVRCETLVQGEGGTIAGNITAESAHISGLVDGMVSARIVTMEPTGRITGDVTYETLSIAAGGAIEGRLTRREGAPAGQLAAETTLPLTAIPAVAEKKRPRPARSLPKADGQGDPVLLPNLEMPAAANG